MRTTFARSLETVAKNRNARCRLKCCISEWQRWLLWRAIAVDPWPLLDVHVLARFILNIPPKEVLLSASARGRRFRAHAHGVYFVLRCQRCGKSATALGRGVVGHIYLMRALLRANPMDSERSWSPLHTWAAFFGRLYMPFFFVRAFAVLLRAPLSRTCVLHYSTLC